MIKEELIISIIIDLVGKMYPVDKRKKAFNDLLSNDPNLDSDIRRATSDNREASEFTMYQLAMLKRLDLIERICTLLLEEIKSYSGLSVEVQALKAAIKAQ